MRGRRCGHPSHEGLSALSRPVAAEPRHRCEHFHAASFRARGAGEGAKTHTFRRTAKNFSRAGFKSCDMRADQRRCGEVAMTNTQPI
jgi:hypothetical protein